MQRSVHLDESALGPLARPAELEQMQPQVEVAHRLLQAGGGAGQEFRGWLGLPVLAEAGRREELQRLHQLAAAWRQQATALVVIGIGGSYLGARAAIEMLLPLYRNDLPQSERRGPKVYYLGNHLSPDVTREILHLVETEDVVVNVISKSGTTTEPAIAFRLIREALARRYTPTQLRQRIAATTDSRRGALKQLAEEEGYPQFVIPDDVGGRYSVLTPVGLLPMAVTGIDVEQVLAGAAAGRQFWSESDLAGNDAYRYAAWRNVLARKGKEVELLANFDPHLHTLGEWWKQLFGESEGKDGKALYPASVDFTTDLHSLGQYIQEGRRILIETVLHVSPEASQAVPIPEEAENRDGLGYLVGQPLAHVNEMAYQATVAAHRDGGVPVLQVHLARRSPEVFGQLVFFFETACAISGYLLGVNPFDQPGVEAYKKNMFRLLGKPGA